MMISGLGIPTIAQVIRAMNTPQTVNFSVGTANLEAASVGAASSAGASSSSGDCASCGGSFSATA